MRLLHSILFAAVALGGCSTYTTPRYSISADTNVALKAIGASNIAVGVIFEPASFSSACRAAGPLSPPDGMPHAAYIKKALEDELKVAGVYAAGAPRVTLTGAVTRLEFSSARGLTGGAWDVNLTLSSSNGKSMTASEHYEFESGFTAETACKQTSEAFMPAVQNLIGKVVKSSDFRALVL